MPDSQYIFGLHAVEATLAQAPNRILEVWVSDQRPSRRTEALIQSLQGHSIPIQRVSARQLDQYSDQGRHQGVVIRVRLPQERDEAALKQDLSGAETPFYLVLDQVSDPHNLGACLRTAEAAGVNGVIVPKDQACRLNATVCKVACGAAERVPLYRVTNLARTLRWMQESGVWLVGAAGEAEQTVYEQDLSGPLAVVMGAEGSGLRRLTREVCDHLVKIPMRGQIESLNVSVATGILLFEVVRQQSTPR